ERLFQLRIAWNRQMLGMGEHGIDHLLGVALFPEDRRAVLRVVVQRRVHLVVEVMKQADGAPELLVLAELPRVPAHARLGTDGVTQLRFALRVLGERLPGVFACDFHRVGRLPRCRRRPSSDAPPSPSSSRAAAPSTDGSSPPATRTARSRSWPR